MTTTLLQGVNGLLKRVGKIAGDAGELSSLTDSPRQRFIDTAVKAWNDVIDEMYGLAEEPRPNVLAEATITLATGDRDYALNAAVVKLLWPLQDETNGQYIMEWTDGYLDMVASQPYPASYTGLPIFGCIRPTDGELYLDAVPTADENGLVYKYRYHRDTVLSAYDDTMPFTDIVERALEPAAAEMWRRINRENFDGDIYRLSLGRAAGYLRGEGQPNTWLR